MGSCPMSISPLTGRLSKRGRRWRASSDATRTTSHAAHVLMENRNGLRADVARFFSILLDRRLCLPLRDEPLHLLADELALKRGEVVYEDRAVEVVGLVLHGDGQEPFAHHEPLLAF